MWFPFARPLYCVRMLYALNLGLWRLQCKADLRLVSGVSVAILMQCLRCEPCLHFVSMTDRYVIFAKAPPRNRGSLGIIFDAIRDRHDL